MENCKLNSLQNGNGSIGLLDVNGEIIASKNIENVFNNYFAKIERKLTNNINSLVLKI